MATPFNVVSAPRVTALLYVCSPEVFTTPPFIAVVPPAVIKLARAIPEPLPTAAANVVVPGLFMVRPCVPSIVEENRIALVLLEVIVTAPFCSVTGLLKESPSYPLKIIPPVLPSKTVFENVEPVSPSPSVTESAKVTGPVTLMPERAATESLNRVLPLLVNLIAAPKPSPIGVVTPTLPVNVVRALPALTVRSRAPSTVLLKLMAELVEEIMESALSTTGPLKVMAPEAVLVTLPTRVTLLLDVALYVCGPTMLMPPEGIVGVFAVTVRLVRFVST